MNSFSKALENFSTLDPNTAIADLHNLFAEISKMDVEEVVAAKETLDFYKTATELDDCQQQLLNSLITAVCRRARVHATLNRHMHTQEGLFGGAFTKEDLLL